MSPDLTAEEQRSKKDKRGGSDILSAAERPRKRVALACAACRGRKTKCDSKIPSCSYCVKHGIQCRYEPNSAIRNGDSIGSNLPETNSLIQQILSRLTNVEDRLHNVEQRHVNKTDILAPGGSQGSAISVADDAVLDPDTFNSDKAVSSSSAVHPRTRWWKSSLEDTFDWPVLDHTGDPALKALGADPPLLEGTGSLPISSALEKQMTWKLVETFLEQVHTKNPILDITSLRQHTTHVLSHGLDWDGSTCLVLLVCALGSIAYPYSAATLHDYSESTKAQTTFLDSRRYFDAAKKRLGCFLGRKGDLLHAQCLFLAGVYLMYSLRPLSAWETFHAASVACYINLQRGSTQQLHSATTTPEGKLEKLLEQRLYWSCMKSETELSDEFGFAISPLLQVEYPYLLPSPPLEDSRHEGQTNPSIASTSTREKSWYYYLTEITLRKLEIQAHRSFARLEDEEWSENAHELEDLFTCVMNGIDEFEEQLTSIWRSLHDSMHFEFGSSAPCPDELREYLRIKMTWIRHDLCRIPLNLLLHNAEFVTFPRLHQRMAIMANRALSLSVWMMKVTLNTHRNHGTWLGFRLSVRSALEVIAARKSANECLVIPSDFENTARTMIQGLRYWEDEYPDVGRYLSILASLDDAFAE